jgi:hypothetical protein
LEVLGSGTELVVGTLGKALLGVIERSVKLRGEKATFEVAKLSLGVEAEEVVEYCWLGEAAVTRFGGAFARYWAENAASESWDGLVGENIAARGSL